VEVDVEAKRAMKEPSGKSSSEYYREAEALEKGVGL